jgi:hypothetical protein
MDNQTRPSQQFTRTDRAALELIMSQLKTYGGECAQTNYALLCRIQSIVRKQLQENNHA